MKHTNPPDDRKPDPAEIVFASDPLPEHVVPSCVRRAMVDVEPATRFALLAFKSGTPAADAAVGRMSTADVADLTSILSALQSLRERAARFVRESVDAADADAAVPAATIGGDA